MFRVRRIRDYAMIRFAAELVPGDFYRFSRIVETPREVSRRRVRFDFARDLGSFTFPNAHDVALTWPAYRRNCNNMNTMDCRCEFDGDVSFGSFFL